MKIKRHYQNLEKLVEPNKALIIYGPRRVGKTTLLNDYLGLTKFKYKLENGDNIRTREILSSSDFEIIKEYFAGYDLVAIDEAQRIPDVGYGLKILVDQIPNIRIIATGSSSFELAGQIGEPLTGRKKTITLFPISQNELLSVYNKIELSEKLGDFLVFGSYPEVINAKTNQEKKTILDELVHSYLLKDILELDRVKSPKNLLDLLRLVAYQVGNEVSMPELASQVGIESKTVARYLYLLEKSFVLYNLRGFSKNLRKEITKKSKYYFYDNGIRNAIINNFNKVEVRDDVGKLWENFLIAERLKHNSYQNNFVNSYFWRTWEQKEVDYVEEKSGKLFGYEFKWNDVKTKNKNKKSWISAYPGAQYKIINRSNYKDFIGIN